jgi:hypothetical protein
MRVMEIPPFPRKFENLDLGNLFKVRLSKTIVLWPQQAVPLIGYMGWPNDPVRREGSEKIVRNWSEGSHAVPRRLGRIQHEWLRVADVLHHYCDLVDGQHQNRRGGPSIGKAITLVEANAKGRGTGAASLWQLWERYKDVAHLVTAASLVCAEARTRAGNKPFGPYGLDVDQFGPFQMTMLIPDLVLAVALEFEQRGLSNIPHARTEPVWIPKHCGAYRRTSMLRRHRRLNVLFGLGTRSFSTNGAPAIGAVPISARLLQFLPEALWGVSAR